jgi:hypothetical protein
MPTAATLSERELREIVWHECMHLFLNQLGKRKYSDAEEYTATNLAKAFVWWSEHLQKSQEIKP